ncbi:MAG: single-stranded-DNA-specific exonuclease RecJ [Parcubacteria group bacterium]|nr:single-stranded-DNA-specific exonuclease RecJ [Parcubacteria group bacterium]
MAERQSVRTIPTTDAIWELAPDPTKEFEHAFRDLHPIVRRLLWQRGLRDLAAIEAFIDPSYERDMHDPFFLRGMREAVERIVDASRHGEAVVIHGDYDVDGITATALLSEALLSIGIKPALYLPEREREGYGLNLSSVTRLAKEYSLAITVDCGITAREEVMHARKLGLTVIVTDHHEPPAHLPEGIVINPKQLGDPYPYKYLAGVGVAFKLAQALLRTVLPKAEAERREKWLLDLVALGSIADVVPLTFENRTLVTYGLKVLRKSPRVGLKALAKASGIALSMVNAYEVGFILAPRLNAAGRLATADMALNLVMETNPVKADEYARELSKLNATRQRLTEKITEEAIHEVTDEKVGMLTSRVLFLAKEGWPHGIVGLVASRLAERFTRPALVGGIEDGVIRGSARSIPGVNIVEFLRTIEEHFERFGGHPAAAGFTLKRGRLREFTEALHKEAARHIHADQLVKRLLLASSIDHTSLTWEVFGELESFAPFGHGNSRPLFLIENAEVLEADTMGSDGKHGRMTLRLQDKFIRGVGFRMGERMSALSEGDRLDLAVSLEKNGWNGKNSLELRVVDFKRHQAK